MHKIIIAFLIAASFSCASPLRAMAAEIISTPTISVTPDIYYPFDEILYLEGNAAPETLIQVQFQKSGAKPVTMTTRSDVRGEWVLAGKVPLDAGAWEVRARLVTGAGAISAWSNPRLIKAVATGIVLGGVSVTYVFLLLIFLSALGAAAALAWYFYSRMKRFERRAKTLRIRELEGELRRRSQALEQALLDKDKQEAEAEVEKSVSELRALLLKELEHFEETAGGRALTREEQEHKERLVAELKSIQEKIELKIDGHSS